MNSTIKLNNISVVRVVSQFYPLIGGSATHTQELSKKIDPYLKDQTIIAPNLGDRCANFDKTFGIRIIRIRYFSFKTIKKIPLLPFVDLFYAISIYSTLKKVEKPDIIHAHGISNVAYCTIIGKIFGIPVVGMLHGSGAAYSRAADIYETILATLCKPNLSFVLDDGSATLSKFKKIWGDKVIPVYHGIDTEYFKPTEKNNQLLNRLGLDISNFIILSTSSFHPVKNIDLAIKSFKLFLDSTGSNNSYLLLAGRGPLKDSLINLTKELQVEDQVIFLGELSKNEIIEYLSIADVVIATSLYSNMNLSVQEAMACEKPVLAFDSGATSNLVKHLENGLLAKSGELEGFVFHLNLLYRDLELRTKIGKNARKTILMKRTWEERIKRELDFYSKILIK
ncbi:glycosyltransferase family 4 protein [Methanosarcina acetivorans]|uniref:LPS biosynthesis protein n=1 Tax=Methanosarcina acetivorans (strain ATCC 35395 / DSM 2834 / JCM 12185 / C2A) TaxID=188937 RepID=Q8TNV0_METAC|nr:glycosyltransferase family 4 protein [Methanosarcina acetivorans]AAM05575.1 LPS biosynthesis protein [Methanosarcina acetivorans C2A]